ncbi:MAG: flagellar basal body P-ring protein FlgI [Pseudomonadota bacterium]
MRHRKLIIIAALLYCFGMCNIAGAVRIKDMAAIKGVRTNQLIGYGLVVGLEGTGDKAGTSFTIQSLVNMMEQMGIHVEQGSVSVKNVAAVMVTSDMPPFARIGNKLDVSVASIGDAKSLLGGTLLLTPLRGVDGKVYALAQGALAVGGYSVGGDAGGGVAKNHPTAARIAAGATIEKEIAMAVQGKDRLTIALNQPDFTTSKRMADVINSTFQANIAFAIDSGTLEVNITDSLQGDMVSLIAKLEKLEVTPDTTAKVVVNEKTGTVVIGQDVRITTVAIAHGNLQITIKEQANVYPTAPFSPPAPDGSKTAQTDLSAGGVVVAPGSQTVVAAQTDVSVQEEKNNLIVLPAGTTITELVRALNAIGVTPRDLVTIFQSLRAAGALQAELEII